MFKRENRLIPGARFNNANVFSASQLTLKKKRNGMDVNRFGVVVSKKIDKRAVVRNKIKRILRDALVSLSKNMIGGHDILIIVKIGILNKTKEENYSIIKNTLEKASLFKK